MYVCVYVHMLSMYGASGGQKRELEILELECHGLLMLVLGTEFRSSARAVNS